MRCIGSVFTVVALVFGLSTSAHAADRAPVTYRIDGDRLVETDASPAPVSVSAALREAAGDTAVEQRVLAESLARMSSSSSPVLYGGHELWITAGDLDTDGGGDLVRMQQSNGVLVLDAVRGSDGTSLWTYEQPSTVGRAFPARVGPDASDGLLLVTYEYAYAGVYLYTLDVTAVTGNGERLWQRSYDGIAGPLVASEQPFASAIADAASGHATDVLVSRQSYVATIEQLDTDVVDGTDGAVVSTSTHSPSEYPCLLTFGDLSGDGLDDYAWLEVDGFPYNEPGRLTAYASDDGRVLWDISVPDEGDYEPYRYYRDGPALTDVGDVTGDGLADIVVAMEDAYYYPFVQDPQTMWLHSGADGAALWWTATQNPRRIGDVDGDGVADIGTVTPDYRWRSDTIGVRHTAFSGDGLVVYDETYELPVDRAHENSTRLSVTPDAGDVDGDGLSDAGHDIRVVDWDEDSFESDRGIVSGGTARLLWSGRMDQPLHATVDGTGDDLASSIWREDEISIETTDGATGSSLWTSAVSVPSSSYFGYVPHDVDGDGRSELVLDLEYWDDEEFRYRRTVQILSAVDGSTLWRSS